MVSPSPGLGRGVGGLSASYPPPLCLCEVTRCRQRSPAHLPFYHPGHNQGKPGRRRGAGRWKTKREQRRCSKEAKRQGASFPQQSWPACPHQHQPCATPGCRPPGPPLQRLAVASQGVPTCWVTLRKSLHSKPHFSYL